MTTTAEQGSTPPKSARSVEDGCNATMIEQHNPATNPECIYGPGVEDRVVCLRCGVPVVELDIHNEWHRSLGFGK